MIRRVIIIIIGNLVEWLLAKNKIRHNLIISDSDTLYPYSCKLHTFEHQKKMGKMELVISLFLFAYGPLPGAHQHPPPR